MCDWRFCDIVYVRVSVAKVCECVRVRERDLRTSCGVIFAISIAYVCDCEKESREVVVIASHALYISSASNPRANIRRRRLYDIIASCFFARISTFDLKRDST